MASSKRPPAISTILVVDDEQGIREGLATAMRRQQWDAVPVAGIGAARTTLAHREIDCILLDVRLKDGDGLELLRELKAGPQRDIPVIVATAYGDGERTIAAMRDGAFDYLTKPFDLVHLASTVRRALDERNAKVHPLEEPSETLVGRSTSMQDVWKRIGRAAASTQPVLVRGERGAGKETVARAVHGFSPARSYPLRSERAAGLTLERMQIACDEPGMVILDEIAELPVPLVHVLVSMLQAGTKARVVATLTRTGLETAPHDGIDQALFFELAVVEVDVPPLRARKSDIPLLVAHALRGAGTRAVSEAAMSRLLSHDWPGNVGELVSVLRRAAALSQSEIIDERHLPEEIGGVALVSPGNPYLGLPMRDAVAALERDLLVHALDQAGGNRTSAAKLLGIARAQLYAKLAEHDLESHGRER